MGYNSTLLGSNVTSSYLHIDNLRNDLTTGKDYEAAGVKYLQRSHDGTNAKLVSSSGRLDLYSGSTFLRIHESAGTHYLGIEVGAAGGVTFSNSAGGVVLSPVNATTYCYTAGTASQFLVANATNTESITMTTNAGATLAGLVRTTENTLPLGISSDSGRIRFSQGANTNHVLEFWDVTKNAWWKATLDNGAWVISAV